MEMQHYPGEVGGPAGCRQSNPHHHPGAGPRVTPTQIGPTPTQRHLTHQGRGDPQNWGDSKAERGFRMAGEGGGELGEGVGKGGGGSP